MCRWDVKPYSLSVLLLAYCFVMFARADFDVAALLCICVLSAFVLVNMIRLSVPVQVIDWKDLSPK